MKLKEYLKTKFESDIKLLKFQKPGSVILENAESFQVDRQTLYFGGKDWKNLESDIKHINKENLENFLICLFTITLIDLTVFTYYRNQYELFRSKTMYPKFGWSGFGAHYENPKKILTIPQARGLVNFTETTNNIEEYIQLFIEKCNSFFGQNIPEIGTTEFISKMIADLEFQISDVDKNTLFESIINKFKEVVRIS